MGRLSKDKLKEIMRIQPDAPFPKKVSSKDIDARAEVRIDRETGEKEILYTSVAGPEDIYHELGHYRLGHFSDILEDKGVSTGTLREHVDREIAAWLFVEKTRGRVKTDFLFRITWDLVSNLGVAPSKAVSLVERALHKRGFRIKDRKNLTSLLIELKELE